MKVVRYFFLLWIFLPVAIFAQNTPSSPPNLAPMPGLIHSAKKIFISNTGADAPSWVFFRYTDMPNEPYQSFFTAMSAWGHFTLVDDPLQADLVAEIHFRVDNQNPSLGLSLIDARTHFTMWTLVQPVDGAFRKSTWRKNYLAGVSNLMDQLKSITSP
jgi:hypothetical protein